MKLRLLPLLAVLVVTVLTSCKKEPDMSDKGFCLLTGKQRFINLKYGSYMEYQKQCENGVRIWVTHKYTSTATKQYYIDNNIKINWQEAKIR